MNSRIKQLVQGGSLAVICSFAPVAFSPKNGVQEAQACAQTGSCCPEDFSTCVIGTVTKANAYYKSSGSCHILEDN